MKKIITNSLIIALCTTTVVTVAQPRDSVGFTGAVQKIVVPSCATSAIIDAYGAQGQNGGGPSCRNFPSATAGGIGGMGGEAMGMLSVTAGDTLYVYVGGQMGWNGGGDTGTGYGLEGGFGGGASDVRVGGMALANRVIVAGGGGGGGGGGSNSLCSPGTPGPGGNGGAGGGVWGDTSTEVCTGSCPTQGDGGLGGTLVAGGTGGSGGIGPVANGLAGGNGTLGQGGMAGGTTYNSPPYWSDATGIGGGGGGGYYGGGGGGGAGFAGGCGAPGGGGGGGSSYTGGVTSATTVNGVNTGNGYVIITFNCATGTSDLNLVQDGVKFYPNPASGRLNVDVTVSMQGTIILSMYNMLGENVGSWQVNKGHNELNIQTVPAGVYNMQIKTQHGIINKKLVKVN